MTLKEKGRKPTPDTPATGVGASLEYRMVATLPSGKTHRWPKRNIDKARKAVVDFYIDEQRSHYWRGAKVHIEQRRVGEWERVEDGDG